jgi:outer membrane protein OmpA-like peptidoglycan-associated protein
LVERWLAWAYRAGAIDLGVEMRLLATGVLVMTMAASAPVGAAEPNADYSVEAIERSLGEAPAQAKPGGTRGFSLTAPSQDTKARPAAKPGSKATRPQPRPQPAVAAPRPAPTFNLLITFANGSAELTDKAKANLRVFAQALRGQTLGAARFSIDGHTNAVGARAYNQSLSMARAAAVVDFLQGQGLERARFDVKGFGFDQLRNPRDPRAAENRRVEARRLS